MWTASTQRAALLQARSVLAAVQRGAELESALACCACCVFLKTTGDRKAYVASFTWSLVRLAFHLRGSFGARLCLVVVFQYHFYLREKGFEGRGELPTFQIFR